MAPQEILSSVQFVVGADGELNGAILDIATWESLVMTHGGSDDSGILLNYLGGFATMPPKDPCIPVEEAKSAVDRK